MVKYILQDYYRKKAIHGKADLVRLLQKKKKKKAIHGKVFFVRLLQKNSYSWWSIFCKIITKQKLFMVKYIL